MPLRNFKAFQQVSGNFRKLQERLRNVHMGRRKGGGMGCEFQKCFRMVSNCFQGISGGFIGFRRVAAGLSSARVKFSGVSRGFSKTF